MYISVLDLFKIGIGPSSSHTMGPMLAALNFRNLVLEYASQNGMAGNAFLRCVLKGSLACTGKGHATDRAILLGLNGYTPKSLSTENVDDLVQRLSAVSQLALIDKISVAFECEKHIVFDCEDSLPEHPNGMVFELVKDGKTLLTEIFFSIGGGFINTQAEIKQLAAPIKAETADACPYPFDSAKSMIDMSEASGLSIADMKRKNEYVHYTEHELNSGLDKIWQAMCVCIEKGMATEGELPGGLKVQRRARQLFQQLQEETTTVTINDWLCVYAMAVNEENAAGHMVVTAPTNGAAGVLPAVMYYFFYKENNNHGRDTEDRRQIHDFLLTAAAVGGLIKHRSSISGAEVGCQGEVGSAAAMAAAGLCAVLGGDARQVENAAEIALEHHLGMTCDPVAGLVQVPCIERNGFGAIKAYTAAKLAWRGSGQHIMPLDSCIEAMKQTGLEMSDKYKETALGGLAVSITEC